jgi:hypothetical protein
LPGNALDHLKTLDDETFDLFVKHLLFYSGGIINLGIEILPTKKMQCEMSSGVAYYEGEVYNVLRHGPIPVFLFPKQH